MEMPSNVYIDNVPMLTVVFKQIIMWVIIGEFTNACVYALFMNMNDYYLYCLCVFVHFRNIKSL